jgi:hypothetical protein
MADNATCFVIQPFDGDMYDKRYSDIFAPAIEGAFLEPYRVDRDPGVSVPINDIEAGIRKAKICFAEITTDNPNVWFELGFAIAASKEVVLVCSEDRRSNFPFDVQHRSIIKYRTGAPQDYTELGEKITKRIIALLNKEDEVSRVSNASPIKDTEGLSQHEIVALVAVAQNELVFSGAISAWAIQTDMNRAGFTDIAVSLALKALTLKGMLTKSELEDERGEAFVGFSMTANADKWLLANQDRLVLTKPKAQPAASVGDDIPF